jgi:acyl carrier protein
MEQQQSEIKEQVRTFILDELARRKGITVFSDDESLTENGVVDSLGTFRLVTFLENSFNLRIADEDIVHENFRSVSEIERFVNSKLNAKAAKA